MWAHTRYHSLRQIISCKVALDIRLASLARTGECTIFPNEEKKNRVGHIRLRSCSAGGANSRHDDIGANNRLWTMQAWLLRL